MRRLPGDGHHDDVMPITKMAPNIKQNREDTTWSRPACSEGDRAEVGLELRRTRVAEELVTVYECDESIAHRP